MNATNYKSERAGKVYLVGAGPGDPELLTLRALRVLGSADFVLHDALVSAEVLAMVAANAVLENVGKRCGERAMRQEQIHARMIELALAGFDVVRLQGGDPAVFGRAGEEIAALAQAGVEMGNCSGNNGGFRGRCCSGNFADGSPHGRPTYFSCRPSRG